MNHLRATCLVVAFLAAVSPAVFGIPVFFGPSAYLSAADIPTGLYASGPTFLEDFEDGTLGGGITASAGAAIPPGFTGIIDSVDGDDGFIDGSGLAGHSWFFSSGATGVRFFFPTGTTAAGLVWTDGGGTVTFDAFGPGPGGALLGTYGPFSGLPDGAFTGGTAEDRFFGVTDAGGIGSIRIRNSSGGIEVDHVQYGLAVSTVPDATGNLALVWLGIGGLCAFGRSLRRKSGD